MMFLSKQITDSQKNSYVCTELRIHCQPHIN